MPPEVRIRLSDAAIKDACALMLDPGVRIVKLLAIINKEPQK